MARAPSSVRSLRRQRRERVAIFGAERERHPDLERRRRAEARLVGGDAQRIVPARAGGVAVAQRAERVGVLGRLGDARLGERDRLVGAPHARQPPRQRRAQRPIAGSRASPSRSSASARS